VDRRTGQDPLGDRWIIGRKPDERGGRGVLYPVWCWARDEGGTLDGENADGTEGLRQDAPQISGFLGRGTFVVVSARTGNDLEGYVCDQNESGLLLDVRDSSGDATTYEFLPWSSIERVSVGG
jgi:hypothetical protein